MRQPFVYLSGRSWHLLCLGAIAGLSIQAAGCEPVPSLVTPSATPIVATPQTFEHKLAVHLQNIGAKMYGAHWCPYCARQKELFRDAASQVPYVECDPSGQNAQPQLCASKGLEGYPTWEINGKLYPGQRSLQELADISNLAGTAPSAPITTNP